MENNYIDKIIKEKLQRIEVDYQPDTWELLEQKLDRDEQQPTPIGSYNGVDKAVYAAIHNFEVPYNEAHWKQMEEYLDETFVYPQQVVKYKLAELGLLLLLFLAISQFITFSVDSEPESNPKEKVIAPIEVPIAGHEVKDSPNPKNKVLPSSITEIEKENASTQNSKTKYTRTKTIAKNDSKHIPTTITTNKHSKTITKTSTSVKQDLSLLQSKHQLSTSKISASNEKLEIANNSIEAISSSTTNTDSKNKNIEGVLQDIPRKTVLLATAEAILPLPILPFKKKPTLRVGMFANANVDYIYTIRDKQLEIPEYTQWKMGYGGGISLNWRFNKWEIGTALTYSAKRYRHAKVLHITGDLRSGGYERATVTHIQLNTVSLPLHISYHAFRKNKWSFYGLTGGTMHLVMQANYDADDEDLGEELKDGGGQGVSFSGASIPVDQSPVFNHRNYTKGWLADKDFKTNSFYSLDIGLGVERYITPYWNVFLQPTFQYNFSNIIDSNKGIGPNQDQISTLNILVGVKRNLE